MKKNAGSSCLACYKMNLRRGKVSDSVNNEEGAILLQGGPWSRAEDDYLLQNWGCESAREIGGFLGRSKAATNGRARRLGLSHPTKPPPTDRLTEPEIAAL